MQTPSAASASATMSTVAASASTRIMAAPTLVPPPATVALAAGGRRSHAYTRRVQREGTPTMAASGSILGNAVLRLEDPTLLTGEGKYVDDLVEPGMLHVAFVRSTVAHANDLVGRHQRCHVDARRRRRVPRRGTISACRRSRGSR